jgi:hypothetical protein
MVTNGTATVVSAARPNHPADRERRTAAAAVGPGEQQHGSDDGERVEGWAKRRRQQFADRTEQHAENLPFTVRPPSAASADRPIVAATHRRPGLSDHSVG